jgi:hypothetical protein
VMAFIDAFYRSGHVLSTNRALFDWQYETTDGSYNLAVAFDPASSRILGILGFIDSKRYDNALSGDNCLWLALWQVRPGAGVPTLGPALLAFVRENVEHKVLAVSGVRAATTPMYRAMGFVVTEFRHYYMTNPDVKQHIGIISGPTPRSAAAPSAAVQLQKLTKDVFVRNTTAPSFHAARVPRKSATYFLNRYLCHPFYEYSVHLVRRNDLPIGLLATRIATHDGRRALRVVDLLLEPSDIPGIASSLLQLVKSSDCEYVDLLQCGVDDSCLRLAGLVEVDSDAGVVIPNYFEPFVRENRRMTLCFRGNGGDRTARFIAFRADGDQDRPSLL